MAVLLFSFEKTRKMSDDDDDWSEVVNVKKLKYAERRARRPAKEVAMGKGYVSAADRAHMRAMKAEERRAKKVAGYTSSSADFSEQQKAILLQRNSAKSKSKTKAKAKRKSRSQVVKRVGGSQVSLPSADEFVAMLGDIAAKYSTTKSRIQVVADKVEQVYGSIEALGPLFADHVDVDRADDDDDDDERFVALVGWFDAFDRVDVAELADGLATLLAQVADGSNARERLRRPTSGRGLELVIGALVRSRLAPAALFHASMTPRLSSYAKKGNGGGGGGALVGPLNERAVPAMRWLHAEALRGGVMRNDALRLWAKLFAASAAAQPTAAASLALLRGLAASLERARAAGAAHFSVWGDVAGDADERRSASAELVEALDVLLVARTAPDAPKRQSAASGAYVLLRDALLDGQDDASPWLRSALMPTLLAHACSPNERRRRQALQVLGDSLEADGFCAAWRQCFDDAVVESSNLALHLLDTRVLDEVDIERAVRPLFALVEHFRQRTRSAAWQAAQRKHVSGDELRTVDATLGALECALADQLTSSEREQREAAAAARRTPSLATLAFGALFALMLLLVVIASLHFACQSANYASMLDEHISPRVCKAIASHPFRSTATTLTDMFANAIQK
jgi:hypothetical protein